MGPDAANIPKGFALGLTLCEEFGVNELTLVVPNKGKLSSIVVGEFLGESASKQLMAGETVNLRGNIHIRCESPKTLTKRSKLDVVLAFYISSDDLNVIDSLQSTHAAIFVPWLDADGVTWQRTWNAEVPGHPIVETAPVLNPTVEAGLCSLTDHINLSTGLSHPSDMRDAKKLISTGLEPGVSGRDHGNRFNGFRRSGHRCRRVRENDFDAGDQCASRHKDRLTHIVAVQLCKNLRGELLQRVAALENDVNDRRTDGELMLACGVEQGFEFVRERLDGQEIKETRAAFECVERTEDRVERVGVGGVVFEHEHAVLDVRQMFLGFVDELAEEFAVGLQIHGERGNCVLGRRGWD